MSERTPHLLQTLTEEDWQLIVAGLLKNPDSHSHELSAALSDWRMDVAASQHMLSQALLALHHK